MSESKPEDNESGTEVVETEDDASFAGAEASTDEEQLIQEDEPSPVAEAPRRGGRLTGLVAWLALIIAVAAGMAIAWEQLKPVAPDIAAQRNEAALASLSASLAATEDALNDLRDRLSTLSDADAINRRSVEALEDRFRDRLSQIESLPGRLSNLENSVASIQGISSGVRDTWLLAEAEYYMQIANAQLQLAGNPHLAALALELADERVEQLSDPAMIEVRRALADELQALEVMAAPDIEGISLTLASLATVVDSLPLKDQLPESIEAPEVSEEELSGMQRALASLKRTMSSIVSVRRTDEQLEPLVAPEAQYFLRANLTLQLQAARLALLRGEQAIYQQSLDDAARWIEEFYDSSSTPVASALETIAEIRDRTFDVELPDISGSLRLLRQQTALSSGTASEPQQ
jgi:uroporphyrin-3 C-methyltransferase